MVKQVFSLVSILVLVSCGSDSGGTTGPDPDPSIPTSITVSPANVILDAIGATAQFSAVVRDQDGKTMPEASVTWSSTSSSVLSINSSSGLATAVAVGDASVSAISGTVSGSATATVRQVPTLVQLSLATDQIPPGSTTQATLTATDAGGHTIPSPDIVWETGSPSIATVSDQGEVTAVSPGLVHIKGSVGSLSDSTRLSVSSALDEDQVTTLTGANGEAAVFTTLGGGTHFQLSVEDGFGQPLMGATVQYTDVGGKALFAVRGPGGGYAPAFLFGPVDSLLALGEPLSISELPGSTAPLAPGGSGGPQAVISQAVRLSITLPALSTVRLSVLQDAFRIPTFLYQPDPVALGTDGPFRGMKCMTWGDLVQHQKNRLGLIPGWSDAVTTLTRAALPSFFDPVPLEGEADVFFTAQTVLGALTGEDLLAEKVNLLGSMLNEGVGNRRVEVRWDFGDGGPAIRRALGWYRVRTNDRYCGGAIPNTLTPLPPTVTGAPEAKVQASVRVESTWGNVIPGVGVSFSLASSSQGSMEEGALEVMETTNENGVATVLWTLPDEEGSYLLSVSVAKEGGQPLTASITGEAKVSTLIPTSTSLVTGNDHTCGLTPETGAYCWGRNGWGELGVGEHGAGAYRDEPAPVSIPEGSEFTALSAGEKFTCALNMEGRPYCWGRNDQGQLGSGNFWDIRNLPTLVEGGFRFTQLASGSYHSCGLTEGGTAYCWGGNDHGQLGDGTQDDRIPPGPVGGGLLFESLTAGGFHTCGITTSGLAYCWGANEYGTLGDGTLNPSLTPNGILPVAEFTSLTTGWYHTCGLSETGQVYCWGRNTHGQLGIGNKTDTATPTMLTGVPAFSSVDAGGGHTCGVTTDGTSYCWGRTTLGQVGNLRLSDETTPSEVHGEHGFQVLKAGPFHTCGLIADGTAFCWGDNSDWQLGIGDLGDENYNVLKNSPVPVNGSLKFGRPPSPPGE